MKNEKLKTVALGNSLFSLATTGRGKGGAKGWINFQVDLPATHLPWDLLQVHQTPGLLRC